MCAEFIALNHPKKKKHWHLGKPGRSTPSVYTKGQLISKANCQAMNSSKKTNKQMNEFVLTSMRRVFVCFLEEIEDSKKAFWNYLTFREYLFTTPDAVKIKQLQGFLNDLKNGILFSSYRTLCSRIIKNGIGDDIARAKGPILTIFWAWCRFIFAGSAARARVVCCYFVVTTKNNSLDSSVL